MISFVKRNINKGWGKKTVWSCEIIKDAPIVPKRKFWNSYWQECIENPVKHFYKQVVGKSKNPH